MLSILSMTPGNGVSEFREDSGALGHYALWLLRSVPLSAVWFDSQDGRMLTLASVNERLPHPRAIPR